jgi:hypothetical protein
MQTNRGGEQRNIVLCVPAEILLCFQEVRWGRGVLVVTS